MDNNPFASQGIQIESEELPTIPRQTVSSSPVPLISPVAAVAGAASIKRARQMGLNRIAFALKRTGGAAVVRRPSLLALAVSGTLPNNLRGLVDQVVMKQVQSPDDASDALKTMTVQDIKMLLDATAIAGFIDPPLTETKYVRNPSRNSTSVGGIEWIPLPGVDRWIILEQQGWIRCDEHGKPYQAGEWFVDEIDIDDRQEFFLWCQGQEAVAAQTVAPFREVGEEPLDS